MVYLTTLSVTQIIALNGRVTRTGKDIEGNTLILDTHPAFSWRD
jgi:hypothetical protein